VVDRVAEAQQAIRAAVANGWTYMGGGTVRRTTVHETPRDVIAAEWYTGGQYDTHEFLSFVFASKDRVPRVIYGVARCPWLSRTDSKVSFRRAKELLAQPLSESDVHDR
jgi:hypothetical protein